MIRCKISLNAVKVKKRKATPRLNLSKLREPETTTKFADEVTKKMQETLTTNEENASSIYQRIKKSLFGTSSSVLGKAAPKRGEDWLTEDTKNSMKLKKEIRQTLGPNSILYKCHKANVKKLCKIDKECNKGKTHKELDRYR